MLAVCSGRQVILFQTGHLVAVTGNCSRSRVALRPRNDSCARGICFNSAVLIHRVSYVLDTVSACNAVWGETRRRLGRETPCVQQFHSPLLPLRIPFSLFCDEHVFVVPRDAHMFALFFAAV